MSATTPHAGDLHAHRFHAHHFDTQEQQFQAGKLGMWLFLATEVLFFSGMFCAYTIYRVIHPEVFAFAHQFLDPTLGAANTLVLLVSSLSVAWAVRCAQTNKQGMLLANLVFTVLCAGIFMGVKSVEYTLKFHEGLLWRSAYSFVEGSHPDLGPAHEQLRQFGLVSLGIGAAIVVLGMLVGVGLRKARGLFLAVALIGILVGSVCLARAGVVEEMTETQMGQMLNVGGYALAIGLGSLITGVILLGGENRGARWAFFAIAATVVGLGAGCLAANVYTANKEANAHSTHAHSTHGEAASAAGEQHDVSHDETHEAGSQHRATETTALVNEFTEEKLLYGGEGPKFPGIFFSIYYAMTGVHAIHILCGIGVFVWIIYRAAAGHFEPSYYGPVEYVGLYWHLVDLIWIYLFPLLYLIQ